MKIYDYNGKKNICGERVRSARKAMHLSQQELAAKLQVEGINLERDSISRIEIGTRFVADFELVTLCKILNVSSDELLGITK
ncbi:MAG: helix-turn-helix transcriptional regulator [Clostridia bacterium]|nr:helix-turn-helix transcriptional regulator [Clostridia bacterium]